MRMSNELLEQIAVAIHELGGYEAEVVRMVRNVSSKPRVRALCFMNEKVMKAEIECKRRKQEAVNKLLEGTVFRLVGDLIVVDEEKLQEETDIEVAMMKGYVDGYARQNGIYKADGSLDKFGKLSLCAFVDGLKANGNQQHKEHMREVRAIVKKSIMEHGE
jgi:hypothetical protein